MVDFEKEFLNAGIRQSLASKIVKTYEEARKESIIGKSDTVSSACGRFAEQAIAIIHEKRFSQSLDENNIQFESCYLSLEKSLSSGKNTPMEELLFLTMPRVLRSIYTIRNKKEGAHTKKYPMTTIDKRALIGLTNWVFAQMVFIFCKNSAPTEGILPKITLENIPVLQEFEDGRILVYNKQLTEKEKLLVLLYYKDKRISKAELLETAGIKKVNVRVYIRRLKADTFIDENKDGVIITTPGKIEIEHNSAKYLNLEV